MFLNADFPLRPRQLAVFGLLSGQNAWKADPTVGWVKRHVRPTEPLPVLGFTTSSQSMPYAFVHQLGAMPHPLA